MAAAVAEPREIHSYLDYMPSSAAPTFPLLASDGIPMEDYRHVLEIYLLMDILRTREPQRTDYFAGGNIFLYFNVEQARNRDYKGPDFFFVKGVDGTRERHYWAIWDEGGRFPNVIMEMLSPSTEREDRTTKKDLYEKVFHTPEYFVYDFNAGKLEGWRLDEDFVYQTIVPDAHGRLWSEELQMCMGTWKGSYLGQPALWLRGYDVDGNLLPVAAEQAAKAESEVARLKALLAHKNGHAPAE